MIRLKSENSWYFTKLGLILTDVRVSKLSGTEIFGLAIEKIGSAYAQHLNSPSKEIMEEDHAAIFAEFANLSLDKVAALKAQQDNQESYIRHVASKKVVAAKEGPDQVGMKLKFDKKEVDI